MVKVDDAELARTRINRLLDKFVIEEVEASREAVETEPVHGFRTWKPGKLTLTIVARPK